MITCFLSYMIDPNKIAEFEHYGKTWIRLVNEMGGKHNGYLMPFEGPNNIAYASFSFDSLAAYEVYRNKIGECDECQDVLRYATEGKFILSYNRSFMRPVLEEE